MGKTVAIIPAAGLGLRMGGKVKKQYLILEDKPILAHTIQVFQSCSLIDDIVLVASRDEADYCRDRIVRPYSFSKVKKIVIGGLSRQESVFNGIKEAPEDSKILVIHDGVRPLITEDIIRRTIEDAKIYRAAVSAVPVKDTIKISNSNKFVVQTPRREYIWAVHTPQVFEYELLLEAHKKAEAESYLATDDASLVENIGLPVKITPGSYSNIKITTIEDLETVKNFLRKRRY